MQTAVTFPASTEMIKLRKMDFSREKIGEGRERKSRSLLLRYKQQFKSLEEIHILTIPCRRC